MSNSAVIKPAVRQWTAAKQNTLTSNWDISQRAPDVDIRQGLRALRARARHAAQNIDHVRGFLGMVESNLIGRQGIVLQSRAKLRNGKADERIRETVEEQWRLWGRRGQADVTGQFSWKSLQKQAVRTAARDGEAVFRVLSGWRNDYAFALQQIDPECVDVQLNQARDKRRAEIRMGVELDDFRRPVAYYLTEEPGITTGYTAAREHERVPAEEIIHLYLPEWVYQSRGVPWVATPLQRLYMLSGYEDAEITAARVAAAKMGFYRQQPDAAPMPGEENDNGEFVQDVAPGQFEQLPPGWDFVGWDPQHPNAAFGDFTKSALRNIATGLGVSYNALANDLEGVNYSSLRQGAISERDLWMLLQDWAIECFCEPVFERWFATAWEIGALPVPEAKKPAAMRVAWQPRRWQWVDPLKEVQAQEKAVAMRTTSISEIIRERGRDPDEVWEELAADQERLRELGIAPQTVAAAAPTQETDDDED